MTRAGIAIAPAVRRAIVAQARRESPRECCGLLVGDRTGVRFAVALRNLETGTTRYRVDDAWHLALQRMLRQFSPGLSIVGVYHSHPAGPAEPSPTDLNEAAYPEWAYVIIGLAARPPAIRAFRIVARAARELTIGWPRKSKAGSNDGDGRRRRRSKQ